MFRIVVRMERRHLSTPTTREKENYNVFDGFGGGLHDFFMLWMVEWGAWAGPESLQVQWNPCIFHDMFGGVGSMGGFRIIENTKVLHIFHDLCRGVGSMGGPETEHGRAQNH